MIIWTVNVYDKKGRRLAVFSPCFEGNFKEALAWFASRDFIYNNPLIKRIEIKEA